MGEITVQNTTYLDDFENIIKNLADEFSPDFTPNVTAVLANLMISIVSALSQIVVILIAKGLEGDFSAKTFMWVQALFEIAKRIFAIYLSMVAGFCKYFIFLPSYRSLFNNFFFFLFSPISDLNYFFNARTRSKKTGVFCVAVDDKKYINSIPILWPINFK